MIDYAKDYDFPGPWEPMDNQILRFNFLLDNRYALDLSEMGTGKTATATWAADYLMRETGCSVLILAPLTILDTVWRKTLDSVLGNSPIRRFILTKSNSHRARTIRENSNSFFVTNPESLLSREFRDAVFESGISVLILDEVTAFKHPNVKRSRYLRLVAANKVVWGLTATPMPNSIMNAFGVAKAVRQDYLESMTRFRGRTHNKIGQWNWIPREDALDEANKILRPSIRIPREACYSIPAETTETRIVALSDDCKRLYRQLRKHAFATLTSGVDITIAHEAALRNKLMQVAGGAVYTPEGTETLDPGGRKTELVDILQQTDEKLVVYVPFRSQLKLVEGICKEEGYSVVAVHGDTPIKDRSRFIELFQTTRHPRIIVADPRCMSHGVELFAASIIVWWLPIDSAEYYEQAKGRLTRRGQTKHVLNIQLCGTKLEKAAYDRLEKRQSLQGLLLDALQRGEDDVF